MSTPYPPPPGQQPDPQQPWTPQPEQDPYGSAPSYSGAPAYPDPSGYPATSQPYGGVPYGSPAPVAPVGYGYGGYAAPEPGKGFAIAGLVTAIIPCTWVLGLVLSIVALVKVGRGTGGGKGLAIAGVVVSALWLVGGVLVFALGIGTLVQTCAELGNGVHDVDGVTYTCDF